MRTVRVVKTGRMIIDAETAGLSALQQIPGVAEVRIVEGGEDAAVFSYVWTKPGERFMQTDEHLAEFGLARDWGYDPLQRGS